MTKLGTIQRVPASELERGSTLLEAAFAITLFGSLIALANMLISAEAERQRSIALGQDLRITASGVRSYVSGEFDALESRLARLGSTEAAFSVSMQEVADAGFLPQEFVRNGERRNLSDQRYRLMFRGVDRSDQTRPRATLVVADIDADGDGLVDLALADGDVSNGELDLEAILVTEGGRPVPPQQGNPAAAAAESPAAGYIQEAGTARGPYGSWEHDISGYSSLADYPAAERFAYLIALSGFGVLEDGEFRIGNADGFPFERCIGTSGTRLDDCAASNEVHTELAFGSPASPAAIANGLNTVSNVYSIEMGPPVDADNNGSTDLHSIISGLAELKCTAGVPSAFAAGTLIVDCPAAAFSGRLRVGAGLEVAGDAELGSDADIGGSLDVAGDVAATGAVRARRFLADALGGQDLTEGVYFANAVSMGGARTIAKPVCSDPGSSPQVFAAPAAYTSPDGSPIVGVRAHASDSGGGSGWTIGMNALIDRDSDNDGNADLVPLSASDDYALVLTRCS